MPQRTNNTRNWRDYNKSLVKRGEITLWINSSVLSNPHISGRGRPRLYSNSLIEAGLLLKNVYQLTFRQLEGFIKSIYSLMGINEDVPNYTTLCRRQEGISIKLPKLNRGQALTIVVDSTGLKIVGEGEWCVKKHGFHYQRTWRKVHLAIDAQSLDILSCEMSNARTQDSDMLEPLLEACSAKIEKVIGDGAYDTFKCFESVTKRGALPIFPPRTDARVSSQTKYHKKVASLEAIAHRDKIVEEIKNTSREIWKKQSGYYTRSLAETTMYRLKTVLGDRLKARKADNQCLELNTRCKILNIMNQISVNAQKSC